MASYHIDRRSAEAPLSSTIIDSVRLSMDEAEATGLSKAGEPALIPDDEADEVAPNVAGLSKRLKCLYKDLSSTNQIQLYKEPQLCNSSKPNSASSNTSPPKRKLRMTDFSSDTPPHRD